MRNWALTVSVLGMTLEIFHVHLNLFRGSSRVMVWSRLQWMLTICTLQVLSGLVAGVVSLTALKAGAVDLQDERDVRQRGFDLIYEARDLDLDQSTRDGLTQYRKNIDSTKARIKEAEQILDTKLDPLIQKKYWYTFVPAIQQYDLFDDIVDDIADDGDELKQLCTIFPTCLHCLAELARLQHIRGDVMNVCIKTSLREQDSSP